MSPRSADLATSDMRSKPLIARRWMIVPLGIGTTYSRSTLSALSLSIQLEPIWQSLEDFLTSQVDVFASLDARCADLHPEEFSPVETQAEEYDQMIRDRVDTSQRHLISNILGRCTIHKMESLGRDPHKTSMHLFRYDPRCNVT